MRGGMGQMINFPSWLGKNSTQSKNNRLIQELSCHMGLKYDYFSYQLHIFFKFKCIMLIFV